MKALQTKISESIDIGEYGSIDGKFVACFVLFLFIDSANYRRNLHRFLATNKKKCVLFLDPFLKNLSDTKVSEWRRWFDDRLGDAIEAASTQQHPEIERKYKHIFSNFLLGNFAFHTRMIRYEIKISLKIVISHYFYQRIGFFQLINSMYNKPRPYFSSST